MSKLRRAFQLLAAKVPQRTICDQLHMGRGVLSKYKSAADAISVSYADMAAKSNEELEKFLNSTKVQAPVTDQKKTLEGLVPGYASDLAHNRYLTVQMLHERYRKEHPDGYGYTQFKKAIRDYQYAHNLSYHNTYVPGEDMQVDFAGDPLWVTDPKTGEKTKIAVLVCVLPFSGVGYVTGMREANMERFFGGLSDAFSYFGGTTRRAKSDNMKQWVKKYERYEPSFNDAAMEWGAYYDTYLENCRIRHPRDKGPVEGYVNKTYQAVYSIITEEEHHSLASLNSRLWELMDAQNCKPSKTTGKSHWDIFESQEKPALGVLPDTPFRFRYRKTVKLTGNYHVQVDGRFFSVPFQYVGQKVRVVWDIDTVEVYSGEQRIAIHDRNGTGRYSTTDGHMPPAHLAYKHGQGYNAAYYIEEASVIGPYTKAAVEKILRGNKHVEQGYNSCKGMLSLNRTYGRERMEKACKRVEGCSTVTYTMIKNILIKNLDMAEEAEPVANTPENSYVRGPEAFNI